MRRRWMSFAVFLALVLCAAPARAASITFSSIQASPGDMFEMSVLVSSAPDLYSFEIGVSFDSTILSFLGVTNGGLLPSTDFVSAELDNLILMFNSLQGFVPGVVGEGVLAVLTFQAIAVGSGGIDILEPFLFNSGLQDPTRPGLPPNLITPVEVVPADVNVVSPTPVPEPSTLGLLGIGLAALARKRLRRKPHTTA